MLGVLTLLALSHISTINSDGTPPVKKSKLKFPILRSPSYNVSVALGATARLPCTVTNVEHQAVATNISITK